jgi:hypothetical protein
MPQNNPLERNSSDFSLKNLPKPQKTAVVFLFALAILVVGFWIFQLRSHLNQPFDYGDAAENTAKEADYIKALSGSDIDDDGLSDYDEIYTYKTSPYLEDSDSDGLSDDQEITQGTDPNCPQGKDCNAAETLPDTSDNSTVESLFDTIPSSATSSLDASSLNTTALEQALSGLIDATSLRQLLLESGASQEVLDQISDEDLMKSYQETLASQAVATSSNTQ